MDQSSARNLLSVRALPPIEAMTYERLLATALRPLLSELVYTNAGVLMAYIHAGKTSVIDDIMESSAELSLKPGALRYARNATTHTDWGTAPVVTIDMEFHQETICSFFKIVFDARSVGVQIDTIIFYDGLKDPPANLARFADALAAARHD